MARSYYRRERVSWNGLTPSENRELGRRTWALIMFLLLAGSIKLFGTDIFLKWWFDLLLLILGEIAYRFTGFFYRKILRIWR